MRPQVSTFVQNDIQRIQVFFSLQANWTEWISVWLQTAHWPGNSLPHQFFLVCAEACLFVSSELLFDMKAAGCSQHAASLQNKCWSPPFINITSASPHRTYSTPDSCNNSRWASAQRFPHRRAASRRCAAKQLQHNACLLSLTWKQVFISCCNHSCLLSNTRTGSRTSRTTTALEKTVWWWFGSRTACGTMSPATTTCHSLAKKAQVCLL